MSNTTSVIQPQDSTSQDRDENLVLNLATGRRIGYSRYGIQSSKYPTTIYLHGYPSSRLECSMYAKDLFASGLQVIGIDRPGFGLSSVPDKPLQDRTILDHVEDIHALADHLHLDRFAVLAVSGGAPYAFACAYALPPERLVAATVLAGFGTYEIASSKEVWAKLFWLNKLGVIAPVWFLWTYEKLYSWIVPWYAKRLLKSTYGKVINSAAFKAMPTRDQDFLLRGGEHGYEDTKSNIREATRHDQFWKWHVEEARLLAKKWPFELQDLKYENLRMWYGTADVNTPLVEGEKLQAAIGEKARLDAVPDGTHASVIGDGVKYIKEVLNIRDDTNPDTTSSDS